MRNLKNRLRHWVMRAMFRDVRWLGASVVILSDKYMDSAHYGDGKTVYSNVGFNITVLRER
jgi:hypothetical protein